MTTVFKIFNSALRLFQDFLNIAKSDDISDREFRRISIVFLEELIEIHKDII